MQNSLQDKRGREGVKEREKIKIEWQRITPYYSMERKEDQKPLNWIFLGHELFFSSNLLHDGTRDGVPK